MYRDNEILDNSTTLQYGDNAHVQVYGPDRLRVKRREQADTDRLCCNDIDEAIAYLQELKADPRKPTLEHYCYGYEDYEISLVWVDEETDVQYQSRIESEQYCQKVREEWLKKKETETAYQKELSRLKKKFGK